MNLKLGAMLPEVARHLFKRPATVEVPFQPVPAPKGTRGKPVMDTQKCIGCKRCTMDCPAEALEINKEYEYKNEAGKLIRRFSMTVYVDRCTHCSQCEESCPVDAIHMDAEYSHPAYTREDLKFVYKPEPPPAAAPAVPAPAPAAPADPAKPAV